MSLLAKVLLALAALATVGAAVVLYYGPAPQPTTPMQAQYKTATLRLGTTTVVAEVADTDALRAQGLSHRASLEEGKGMWFVFDTDGLWTFWMKDTLIPLDMLWVDAGGTIVTIAHSVRPESYPGAFAPTNPSRYVLEVPGGFAESHGIVEGDIIEF